jgi:PAS domain S-box-containing protein
MPRQEVPRHALQPETLAPAVVESLPDALLVRESGESRFALANAAAERLLGYTRDELLALGPAEVSAPDLVGRIASTLETIRERGHWRGPWRLLRKDGSIVVVEVTAGHARLGSRQVYHAILRDAVERVSDEELDRSAGGPPPEPREADSSSGSRRPRVPILCRVCGIEVLGTRRRAYCSNTCRQRAHYRRHIEEERARGRDRHRRRKESAE